MGFTPEQATVALKGNCGNVQDAINSLLGSQESSTKGPGDSRGPSDRHSDHRTGGSFADRMENRYSDRGADKASESRVTNKGPAGDRETEHSGTTDRVVERGSTADRGGRGGGRGGRSGFPGERGQFPLLRCCAEFVHAILVFISPSCMSQLDGCSLLSLYFSLPGRGRRGGTEDDDEYEVPSKPSARTTLFDYLTDKIPDTGKDSKGSGEAACVFNNCRHIWAAFHWLISLWFCSQKPKKTSWILFLMIAEPTCRMICNNRSEVPQTCHRG